MESGKALDSCSWCLGDLRLTTDEDRHVDKCAYCGYPQITDDIRAKILGLNLARLAKIDDARQAEAAAAT